MTATPLTRAALIAAHPLTREALRAYARRLRADAVSHRWKGDTHKEHRAWLREQAKGCDELADGADDLWRQAEHDAAGPEHAGWCPGPSTHRA